VQTRRAHQTDAFGEAGFGDIMPPERDGRNAVTDAARDRRAWSRRS
jgi:hypothetical protein